MVSGDICGVLKLHVLTLRSPSFSRVSPGAKHRGTPVGSCLWQPLVINVRLDVKIPLNDSNVSHIIILTGRCTWSIYTALIFNMLGICVGQGTQTNASARVTCQIIHVFIVLVANKIWCLFRGWRIIRMSLATGLALSISLSFVLLGRYIGGLRVSTVTNAPLNSGCKAQPPVNFWVIFIPPLLLHVCCSTILF